MHTLIICNVHQKPFVNNLLPITAGFEEHGSIHLVEPMHDARCAPTGAFSPVLVPEDLLRQSIAACPPDLAVFVGGGLAPSDETIGSLRRAGTPIAGVALSDPNARSTSLEIAGRFDHFYTQDPDSVAFYRNQSVDVRLCLSATSPRVFHFPAAWQYVDVLYFGKWSEEREELLAALSRSGLTVRIHRHASEARWTLPTSGPLDTPQQLAAAIAGSRLVIDFTMVHNGEWGPTYRASNRAQIAALGGVPPLIEKREAAAWLYEPGNECLVFESMGEAVEVARSALDDPSRLSEIGRAARQRTLRDHDWRDRAAMIIAEARLRDHNSDSSAAL